MPENEFPKRRYSLKECCTILEIQEDQFREFVRTGIYPEGHNRGKKLLYWTPEDIKGMMWLEENLERFAWYKSPSSVGGKQKPTENEG